MSFFSGLFGPPDIPKLKANKNITGLIRALGYQRDYSIRKDAARALEEIGHPAVEPLLKELNNEEITVRINIIEIFGKIKDPRVIEPLKAVAQKDKEPSVRRAADEVLKRMEIPADVDKLRANQDIEGLIKVLDNPGDPLVYDTVLIRNRAFHRLMDIGPPAVEPLIAALEHKNFTVRIYAVRILGNIDDPRVVEPLIRVLKNEVEPNGRAEAANSLGKIKDERSVEPLIEALKDRDNVVRSAAATALGAIGDVRASQPLFTAMTQDGDISYDAGQALNRLKK